MLTCSPAIERFLEALIGKETPVTQRSTYRVLLAICAVLFVSGCGTPPGAAIPSGPSPADASSGAQSPAAAYCTQSGGAVETRYPFYDANGSSPLQLAGSMQVCVFTSKGDQSKIMIAVDTLYAEQPTLAASAYLAKPPLKSAPPSANPSSVYCSQLGGTDLFGGVNATAGGWAKERGADAIAMCVFPDLSTIDSWGLTYHAGGVIRGADLAGLLRYKPPQTPQLFS
jgi:putative hemolysin